MTDMFSKYRVVLSGETLPEYDRADVLENLADMFKSNTRNMEALLQGKSVPLKKQYDNDQAVRICEKIRQLGAVCEIEIIDEQSLQLLNEESLSEMQADDPNKRLGADSETRYGEHLDDDRVQKPGLEQDKLFHSVLRFVENNIDYYRQKFQQFGYPQKPSFKLSWHWPAFSFFFLWALYRKMWIWAGLYVVGTGLMMTANSAIISLIWLFAWPLCANYIYYRHAISSVRTCSETPHQSAAIFHTGGVSRIAVWVGIILCIGLSSLLTQHFIRQFMESYGEYVADVLPGSGSQIRGDGTPAGEIDSTDGKLSNTSLTLSYLATSLKVILVNQEQSQSSGALNIFMEKLKNNGVKDGWGTPVYVVKGKDRFDLVSAGPDGARNTDDDLVQPVPLISIR